MKFKRWKKFICLLKLYSAKKVQIEANKIKWIDNTGIDNKEDKHLYFMNSVPGNKLKTFNFGNI